MSLPNVTTAIMAGGKSSRMGTDKSFVPILGKPMIEHVLERVDGLGKERIIITNRPQEYSHLGLKTFSDVYKDRGPLGGLHAALHFASNPFVLVIACDMPWLNRELLEHMLSLRKTADIIVPRWTRHPEPLHAIYANACLAPIEESLNANNLKVVAFYGRMKVCFLGRDEIAKFDPNGRSFSNVNTPEDLLTFGQSGQFSP